MIPDADREIPRPAHRVYLDVCALNRPLDDQDQIRVRLEADAVQLILSHVRSRKLVLVVSPAHHVEVAANPDSAKRQLMQLLIAEIGTDIEVDLARARHRAEDLMVKGFKPADAAHVALAVEAGCDFVTVDDRLLRQLSRSGVKVWFGSSIAYVEKEDLR